MERYELPDEWRWATVGEIARSIQYGYTAKSSSEFKGPRYLRITDIQDGLVDWENVPRCEIPAEELSKYLLQKGDIVFARSGATAGKSYLITETPQAVFASYLIRVQTNDQVLPEFLYTYFNSKDYWDHLTTRGNAQPNANAQVLGAVRFPLPPLPEQHRIVKKIESLFAEARTARAALERAEPLLKKFRQAVLSAAFRGELTERDANDEPALASNYIKTEAPRQRDLSQLPTDWLWVRFEDLLIELKNGYFSKKPEFAPPGIPILRVSAVRPLLVNFGEMRYLREDMNNVEQYQLRNGDLLFTRYNGTLGLVGVCAMVRGLTTPTLHPDKLIRARVIKGVLPEYLELYFATQVPRTSIEDKAKSSAGQQGISGKDLKDVPVAIAPLAEQQRIVERIESLFAQAEQIEHAVEVARRRAEKVEQAILARAFRGEL